MLLFTDPFGARLTLDSPVRNLICGIVASALRPGQHDALRAAAGEHALPFLVQPKMGSPDYGSFSRAVRHLAPDLIFVNSYSLMVRGDILRVPRLGGINLHGALLPEFRGPNPIQWAILNGETQTGVTLHHMTETFDAGDIVERRVVPLRPDDVWLDVMKRQRPVMAEMIAENLPKVLPETAPRIPQDESKARSWPRRTPEDGLFAWCWPVRRIHDMIRALVAPLPGARYQEGNGTTVVIDHYLSPARIWDRKLAHVRTIALPGRPGTDLAFRIGETVA
ncbi:methionyl-tRNA formyltransferase [Rhodospira trueperi]|uniref:methionyl-tRNA formyltransferase n=1 Tax=Rhodospira trueperi TaxID=69960 RepID=UPI0015A2AA05|nr:formyltransferase family protein [Rhodospira trueperi]